jgi:PAS domain S-box-containing protein
MPVQVDKALRDELEALRCENAAWRTLAQSITDYIYTVRVADGQATETVHGPGCLGVTGYSSEELAADPFLWYSMILPEDRGRVEEHARQLLANTACDPIEHRITCRDGSVRWVRNTPVLHHDARGRLTAYEGLIRDITDRKRAEETLRQSEARLASIVRAAPIGIGLVSERVLMQVNDRLCEMTGYRVDELQGQSARIMYASTEEFERVGREKYAQVRERGTGSVETRWRRKDGMLIDVLLSSTPLDPQDLKVGVTFTALDITDRKRGEREASEWRRRFELVGAASGQVVYDCHTGDGSIVWSGTIEKVLGYAPEEMAGGFARWCELIHPEDRHEAVRRFEEAERAGGPYQAEYRFQHKSGAYVAMLDRGFPWQHADGTGLSYIGIMADVSEQKRAYEQQQRLEAQLRQQQKLESIGTLAAGVAHEINNPLNGILNYAQLAVNRLPEDNPVRRYAERIVHESERVSEIVRSLLAFARQDQQTHSPARLQDIVRSTIILIRGVLLKDQITVETDLADDLPAIKCRSQQIQQVLLNLMTNARDAIRARRLVEQRPGLIRIQSLRLQSEGRNWIRLTVADNGTGVAPGIGERIFDPFFTTKTRVEGTGLGLSISYGIVKDHHGTLWFESEPGQGARFHVDLPQDNGWKLDGAAALRRS